MQSEFCMMADGLIFLIMGSSKMIVWTLGLNRSAHLENFCKILWIIYYIIIQIEIKNKQRSILFISYIEVTFLNLQHKIQLTDTSLISFKTIGKLIFQAGTVRNKTIRCTSILCCKFKNVTSMYDINKMVRCLFLVSVCT